MFNYYQDFFAGLISGFFSVTICSPFETVRTRLSIVNKTNFAQSYKGLFSTFASIHKYQGWKGFFKGYQISIIAFPFFHSLYFPFYNFFMNKTQHLGKRKKVLISASLAGLFSDTITNPLWIARTRFIVQDIRPQYEKLSSLSHCFRLIYKQQGLKGFFKGISMSFFGLTHVILYFQIYQQLKSKKYFNGSSFQIFLISSVSKIFATSMTYPHILLRSNIHDSRGQLSLLKIIKSIYTQGGLKCFFKGLNAQLLRIIPANAIVFVTYQKIKSSRKSM